MNRLYTLSNLNIFFPFFALQPIRLISRIYSLGLILNVTFLCGSYAQSAGKEVNIAAGLGEYFPAEFLKYPQDGVFIASATKTYGDIQAKSVILTISLVPEIPWTGDPFLLPSGWELLHTSTLTSLKFSNSETWSKIDPYFEIPVRTAAARSSRVFDAGTHVSYTNQGISMFENLVKSNVIVSDILPKDKVQAAFLMGKSLDTNTQDLQTFFEFEMIDESVRDGQMFFYPNPVRDLLKIAGANAGKVQLISNAGKVVFSSGSIPAEGIDMVNLSAGVYIVIVTHKDGSSTIRKVVKQ